ncbi:MAG: N-acetylmuramoyl-L-alanine amidase [Candidatus Adiutrix sp.]|jgi:N-acetylmuramoyl-L-alanine amidase|nr:N-acetylmuramoyl-L-alanine amidase [Candidatus Adiutrix sp.]
MRPITALVIHCSATRPGEDIGAEEIDAWHRARGFDCLGYHFVIRRDGTIEPGRPPARAGAHAAGHNEASLGLCLVGGLSEAGRAENNFGPPQWAALKGLLIDLKEAFPGADILGHRDLPGVIKQCPSFDARAWAAAERLNHADF